MTNQIDKRRAKPVTDEEMHEAVYSLRDYQKWMKDANGQPSITLGDIDGDEIFGRAADIIERLAAERDDAWRICVTWRERAHAAEAKEIPAAKEENE